MSDSDTIYRLTGGELAGSTRGDGVKILGVTLLDGEGNPVDGGSGGSADGPVSGVASIAPSNTVGVQAGRQLLINCTVAGNVKVQFSDASTITIPVQVGLTILPWAATQIFVTGTTATATYYNLL